MKPATDSQLPRFPFLELENFLLAMNKENQDILASEKLLTGKKSAHSNHSNFKTPKSRPKKTFKTPPDVTTSCCNKCGKTPKRKAASLSISLTKPDKSSKCRSHCKHKEQLAHFTNVSVTTLESETESEQSFASTICTQITERSVRSIVRESAACLEIQKLQTLNSQLSSQLSELEHSNKKLQLSELEHSNKKLEHSNKKLQHSQVPVAPQEVSQDDTLTAHGTPKPVPTSRPVSRPPSRAGSVNLKSEAVRDHVSFQGSSYRTPVRACPPLSKTSLDSGYNSVRQTEHTEKEVYNTDAVHYTMQGPTQYTVQHLQQREVKEELWPETGSISKQLLGELEEENEALRGELRSCVQSSHETIRLEGELKSLRAEHGQYTAEVVRLRDIEVRLQEVEAEYRKDKANFRATIEDSLLELDDFRREREELVKDLQGLEEKLKDTQEKKKNLGDEMREQKNIFVNNIEKLKLELETGQSENAMLHTRVNTVEENCAFLEGQVQALERDNQEKLHILTAAEQHAKDLEKEIAILKKEEAVSKVEKVKSGQVESQCEELIQEVKRIKEEKKGLYEKLEASQEQSTVLHTRLAELVKSHTKSEESAQSKDRLLQQMKEELDQCQTNSATRSAQTNTQREGLQEELRQVKEEKESLEQRLEKSEGDMKLLEFASTRGWVSALSSDDEEGDGKVVTFEERPAHTTRAEKLIHSIHLDRQKLKAKLVRSVEDRKTVQEELSETQSALERESAGLAKRLRETVNQLDTNNMQNKVLERTAKNLSVKVEELEIVNRGLELENYHLKKLNGETKELLT